MVEIAEIRKQDYKKAREFAVQGMHLYWYVDNKLLLDLYARYFWNMELGRATRAYGAYVDGKFTGVLLADMKGEPKKFNSFWRGLFVKAVDRLQHMLAGEGIDTYDNANQEMYKAFCNKYTPDGEIVFLAADPESKVKGVGTALLKAFEAEQQGKRVYLYTDNACTYQFYEHRGFERAEERDIVLDLGKKVPLTCFLYTKEIGTEK